MKKIILILSLIIWVNSSAQNEAANWFFGQNAGIQFDNTGSLIGSVNGGQLSTLEGCTTISDTNGNLLFYTDGRLVYNRSHTLMPNGTGLFGDPSSTQSALVVPQPGSDTFYYIFTVDTTIGNGDPDFGFNYSIVDITLDGGLGDITAKNVNLLQDSSEKITAVLKDCASQSIWVITLANLGGISAPYDTYHAFEVSTTGVNTTSVKSTFPFPIGDPRGQIKVSPDGKKFVSANMGDGLFLYDFDSTTGVVSNEQNLSISSFSGASYGVEFSQNSKRLYVHSSNDANATGPPNIHQSTLTQFDLEAANIQGSEFTIDQRQLYRGSLQLAADGKIYRALSANYAIGLPALGVIENPNTLGPAVFYTHNAVDLSPNLSTQGLPPFIQSFFNDQIDIIQNGTSSTELSLCNGENYTLAYDDIPGAVYTWTKDGILLADSDFDLVVTGPGVYTLHIDFNNGACETFDGEATVSYFEVPIANQPIDINLCGDEDNDGQETFDFTTKDIEVLIAQDPMTFEVNYFISQDDADNNVNEIVGNYLNTSNPQEIFVRIQNIGYYGCFDTTSFFIEIFDLPIATDMEDLLVCDDDTDGDQHNGQVETDLEVLTAQVLNGQDPTLFDITYHLSQIDADSGANPITSPYYNTTPSPIGISVRIENNQYTDCYTTTSFDLSVLDLPIAISIADVEVCDDDNDGFFSFDFSELYNATILGTQDPAIFNVQYFISSDDALNNVNAITMPYQTVSNPQTIFARIENNYSSICFDTTSFNIEVFNTPTVNPVADIEVCDDDIDNNDTNGQVTTDLSDVDPIVLGSQDATAYNITYHASQLDADSGANALPTTFYNTIPNTQQIFVRIDDVLNTDCYDTTSFNIIINPLPVVFDSLLFQCDYDGNPDGFTLFNLTEAHDVLTGSVSDLSTHFYLNLADAQGDMDEINGTSFSNTVNPQIINVRVVNDITGCYRLAELTLDVSATTVNDAALFECDTDGIEDGFFEFDLSEANTTVLGGTPPGVTLSYYATSEDALLEVNPLPLNFTNTTANFQTIFVRAENANACYGINQVDLTIYDLPNIEIEDETIYCLNTFPETITLNAGLNSGNPNDFTYSWSNGENTYEIEINGAGTYSVTVTNFNGCSKERTITVLPSNIATINNIDVVDATSNNIITILVSGEGDYEFAIDNIIGPYQDGNVFENVSPGLHTVYIRDKNNCGIVENIISVIGFPKFFTPNGDGYHDTWQVYGLNHSSQLESIVYIFDRFGKLVKQLSPTGIGWDGTFNGQPLPTSDYWFHVKLQDGRTFKSHFTLKH
ncbi:MAG: gliding motility-associated-like protein [bacterium]|jgi:gliding motility-associated-like protein